MLRFAMRRELLDIETVHSHAWDNIGSGFLRLGLVKQQLGGSCRDGVLAC